MPVLCFGPVCIPLNLLLPFLLGVAHHYGWLKWIKREWVTFRYWKQRFTGRSSNYETAGPDEFASRGPSSTSCTPQQAAEQSREAEYACEGGVCRLVPTEDCNEHMQREQSNSARSSAPETAAAAAASRSSVHRRRFA